MFLPLRDDVPQLRSPWGSTSLLLGNLAVFAYERSLSKAELGLLFTRAGVVPRAFREALWPAHAALSHAGASAFSSACWLVLSLFSSMFLHGDLVHLLGNLWFLWLFGARVEGLVGTPRFLIFYFLVGAVAATFEVAGASESVMPMIGASGAIAGVLGAYAMRFPFARVRCLLLVVFFVTFVELPARLLLCAWFLGQFAASGDEQTSGVAWFAHTGGFFAGALYGLVYLGAGHRLPAPPSLVAASAAGSNRNDAAAPDTSGRAPPR